jgi:hypothetical protein
MADPISSTGWSRRRFLATSALATTALAGAGAAMPAAAFGFSLEPADAETSALYLNACSARQNAYHAQLLADAQAALAGKASPEEIEKAVALVTCPICGCPVG